MSAGRLPRRHGGLLGRVPSRRQASGRQWQRRAGGGEEGWTLLELTVGMLIAAIATAMLVPAMTTVAAVVSATQSLSDGSAQARIILSQFTIDIGSADLANICFPSSTQLAVSTSCPSSTATSGDNLRILTDAYGTCQWVQWSVSPDGTTLDRQTWPTSWTSSDGTPAEVTVVKQLSLSNQTVPLFVYDSTNHLVRIEISVTGSTSGSGGLPSRPTNAASQTVLLLTAIPVLNPSVTPGSC